MKTKLIDPIALLVIASTIILLSEFNKLSVLLEYPFLTISSAYLIGRVASGIGNREEKKQLLRIPTPASVSSEDEKIYFSSITK